MNQLPKDPIILLSYINTQLRDYYPSLEELGKVLNVSIPELTEVLATIDYTYDSVKNQFV